MLLWMDLSSQGISVSALERSNSLSDFLKDPEFEVEQWLADLTPPPSPPPKITQVAFTAISPPQDKAQEPNSKEINSAVIQNKIEVVKESSIRETAPQTKNNANLKIRIKLKKTKKNEQGLTPHHVRERERKLGLCKSEEEKNNLITKWDHAISVRQRTKNQMALLIENNNKLEADKKMLLKENAKLKKELEKFSKV